MRGYLVCLAIFTFLVGTSSTRAFTTTPFSTYNLHFSTIEERNVTNYNVTTNSYVYSQLTHDDMKDRTLGK